MNDIPTRPQQLFLVRIWSEAVAPTPAQWRGSVECVANGQKFYFTSLGDMQHFIALQLTAPTDTSKGKTI